MNTHLELLAAQLPPTFTLVQIARRPSLADVLRAGEPTHHYVSGLLSGYSLHDSTDAFGARTAPRNHDDVKKFAARLVRDLS